MSGVEVKMLCRGEGAMQAESYVSHRGPNTTGVRRRAQRSLLAGASVHPKPPGDIYRLARHVTGFARCQKCDNFRNVVWQADPS